MIARLLALVRNNPDYFGSLVSSYGLVTVQVLVQIALIPLYLKSLGSYRFGVLMMLISGVNIAFLGISWTYGGVLRALGQAAAREDAKAFAEGYAAAKWLFTGYAVGILAMGAVLAWINPGGVFTPAPNTPSGLIVQAALFAGLYFFFMAEFAVDQMALNARKRQAVANLLMILSLVVFIVLVIPWLKMGGGIPGVFGCLAAGVVTARVCVWAYWRRFSIAIKWRLPGHRLGRVWFQLADLAGQGYLAYGLIFLGLQTDVLLVGWLDGAHAAAAFILVWKVAEFLIIAIWRLSENLQPELVHADALGDRERLRRIYDKATVTVRLVALTVGTAYGLLGPWLVGLWVGREVAPDSPWGYALAGAAIFWLGIVRISQVFPYTLGILRPLVIVASVELTAKLFLIVVLVPYVGYLAPLTAISIVHICGVALAYVSLRQTWDISSA